MRNVRFLSVALLYIVGSLFLSSANVSAQSITPVDTANFHNGVEKYVGDVLPGNTVQLLYVTFLASGTDFTPTSYSLAENSLFQIYNATISSQSDSLFLTISFRAPAGYNFGDYVDTLTVSARGASDFVLPLRGTVAPFVVDPSFVFFKKYVAFGDTSDVLEPVTITTVQVDLNRFQFSLIDGSAFQVEETGQTPGDPSTVSLGIGFAPPNIGLGVTTFQDTLLVTHANYPWIVYRIPVSGNALPIELKPQKLDFGFVPVDSINTLSLSVKIVQEEVFVSIDDITLTDNELFSYTTEATWNPNVGGTIDVTFTPDTTLWYLGNYLILSGEELDSIRVPLEGHGALLPVLTADTNVVDFGDVVVDTTAVSSVIQVVLTNRIGHLNDGSFTFENPDGIFRLETLQVHEGVRNDTAYVTLNFTPDADGPFENYLVVKSDYADDLPIYLTGTGIEASAPSLSPQQATAISGTVAAAPALSVREGDIVISHAPAGSSIKVYNLAGQALKTQAVASDTEVLKTASFPQSVYIVLVNDRNQEIIRQKVIL